MVSLPAWFDYLTGSFSWKGLQFKQFYLPVKTSWPSAGNGYKIPGSRPCIPFTSFDLNIS